jgi:hypothetical protein
MEEPRCSATASARRERFVVAQSRNVRAADHTHPRGQVIADEAFAVPPPQHGSHLCPPTAFGRGSPAGPKLCDGSSEVGSIELGERK